MLSLMSLGEPTIDTYLIKEQAGTPIPSITPITPITPITSISNKSIV